MNDDLSNSCVARLFSPSTNISKKISKITNHKTMTRMRNTVYGDSPEPGETDPLVSEEVVGNVSKLCVLPPGYRGPPRKGHLIFDANFESG